MIHPFFPPGRTLAGALILTAVVAAAAPRQSGAHDPQGPRGLVVVANRAGGSAGGPTTSCSIRITGAMRT